MSSWVIGAILNISGSVLINLGTNVMKLGHLRSLKRKRRVALADAISERREEENDKDLLILKCCQESWTWIPYKNRCSFRRALLSKTWLIGFGAFFIGNIMNFLSFGYAAQSLLAALGSVQFITNVVFARFVLMESLSTRIILGTLVLICGVGLVVFFSCHGNPAVSYSLSELISLFVDETYLIYMLSLFLLWVISKLILKKVSSDEGRKHNGGKPSKLEALTYAAVSAIIGAQAVTFFKILSELITIATAVADNDEVTRHAVYHSPFSYAVAFAAVFTSLYWIQRLNEALRIYDVLFIVPVFQVMWVTLSVVGGGIFFHEFEQCFEGFTAFMFVVGLITIFFGVFLLSPQPSEDDLSLPDDQRSPLLHHDSLFASGGGMGMTIPAPSLVQAVTLRPGLTPFASGQDDDSSSVQDSPVLSRPSSSLNFGVATFPIVDAVEARDQRATSSSSSVPRSTI